MQSLLLINFNLICINAKYSKKNLHPICINQEYFFIFSIVMFFEQIFNNIC